MKPGVDGYPTIAGISCVGIFAWLLRRTRPEAQHFGRIVVGDDTYIGQNCIILPGSRIGSNCIIGAGVR